MYQQPTPSKPNGGIFTKTSSVRGGGSQTSNSTSIRPSTSSGSISGNTSHGSTASSASTVSFSRKASFTFSSKSPESSFSSRNPPYGGSFGSSSSRYSPERRRKPIPAVWRVGEQIETVLLPSAIENDSQGASSADFWRAPPDNRESYTSLTPYVNMLAPPFEEKNGLKSKTNVPPVPLQISPSFTPESITYQHIHEMASKRISTLDYLRKAHEGRVYWFNTLLFDKQDLSRMPYFDPRKLARRATNYLLLGLSLPTVIDLNSSNAPDFLRTLGALLSEFESFQQIHPPDGSASSSLSRARIPQMFKRSASSTKRRTSSAAEIGLPMGNDTYDSKSVTGSISSTGGSSVISLPPGDADLLPGEEYHLLLTPSLPFDPDFYETFATLCDVLIDCYTKLLSLVPSPKECGPHVGELFTKADGKIRKIIVQGAVKEFEETSRAGLKNEIGGIGKVVLGRLM